MNRPQVKRALISVYDKTGIVDFARALVHEFGIEIISTGGTATLLKKEGIPVTLVEEVTGFPELMDGRVKTLHPKIHAGILADRDNPEHMRQLEQHGIKPIDMVVVNLYPFEKTVADPNYTFAQAIEMIDIGGPCMLRAAAKNHKHVLAVNRFYDFSSVLSYLRGKEELGESIRLFLMQRAFDATTAYDGTVHGYFALKYWSMMENAFPPAMHLNLRMTNPRLLDKLKYGENPHQVASVFVEKERVRESGVVWGGFSDEDEERLHNISFNNYNDASAGMQLCTDITQGIANQMVCVFIKHTNACGVAIDPNPQTAYRNAYLGDCNAAMGGVLVCNFAITLEIAQEIMESFVRWGKNAGAGGFFAEVWAAPSFEPNVEDFIRKSKAWGQRVHLLEVEDNFKQPLRNQLELRSIHAGVLVQTSDTLALNEDQWKVPTKRTPSESEMSDLRLAWLIAKHTKSNAISLVKDGMLIGNGAGQMSRVMSCRIATWLAKENGHEAKLAGSVAASDAFFPFADGPKILLDAGVTALIQPGGSKRDEDTIKLCDERGAAMIFTGTRHFRH